MKVSRPLSAALGALLALTTGGIAVGFYSHPVGEKSQPLSVMGDAGDYVVAYAWGRTEPKSYFVWFEEFTATGADAGALVGTARVGESANVNPPATYAWAYVQACRPRSPGRGVTCSTWFGSEASGDLTYTVAEDRLSGSKVITGAVEGKSFSLSLQPSEDVHPYGNGWEYYSVEPGSRRPLYLFAHRYFDAGRAMRPTAMLVGANEPTIRSRWGAEGRYVHADASTSHGN